LHTHTHSHTHTQLEFESILRQELGISSRAEGEGGQPQQPSPNRSSSGSNSSTPLLLPQLPGGGASSDLEKLLKQQGVLEAAKGGDVDVVLDWKGDPMVIRPGDRMPKWM